MSKIKIQGDGGGIGTFTIISPNSDTSSTVTLPETSGTLITSSQSIVPTQDNTFDLGSSTHRWKEIYVSGNTINLGGQTISANATGIVLPELTIGTGTNTVKLAASSTGKLEQTGTSSTGVAIPTVNIPTVLTDLTDVDLTVAATAGQVLSYSTNNWIAADSILNFSDFTDVDTTTTAPTDKQVLSWNNTNSVWSPSPNGNTLIVATTTQLVALTGMTAGVRALVTELNRLYVYTGAPAGTNWRHAVSGWYAIADITTTNGKPPALTGVSPSYVLDDLGESLVVTTAAVDPEQMPLTWSYSVTSGALSTNTTVVQRDIVTPTDTSNEFTITPGIYPWDTSSFSITFSIADDSLDTTDAVGAFTLTILLPNWGTNSNWHSEISNLDFNATDSASMNGEQASFYGQSTDIDDRGNTVIVSDPYYAAPKTGATGVDAIGAIHIYNKNTTNGISTWTKNTQTLVDPIDAGGATGGDGNPVSSTNIGGFSGNRGTIDDMSTGNQIALSSDGKNIVSMYGNGANTRAPTFTFDSTTSTYITGDSLYLTDVLDKSGNQDGIYLGLDNTLGQTVLGPQPKVAISKDGNTCILGYGMEGPKGMIINFSDPRTDHPLITPHGSLNLPEFGIGRLTSLSLSHIGTNMASAGAGVSMIMGKILSVVVGAGTAGADPNALRTPGTYTGITGTSNGVGRAARYTHGDMTMTTLPATTGPITVVVSSTGAASLSLASAGAGSGNTVGDIITISDANLGGGGAPAVTFTVQKIDEMANRVPGTYTNVTATSSGVGTGALFNVIVEPTSANHPAGFISSFGRIVGAPQSAPNQHAHLQNIGPIITTGAGYAVGDKLTFSDADLGGGGGPDHIHEIIAIHNDLASVSGGTISDFKNVEVIIDTNGARASLDVGQVNFGAAYIFEKTGTGTNTGTPLWNSTNSEWGLTKKISGVNIVDTLGASVDISADGTVAIASAPRGTSDINSLTTSAIGGYVTVFDNTTTAGSWTQVATLRPPTNIIDNSGTIFGQHKHVDTFGAPDALRTVGTYTSVAGTSSGSGTVGVFNIIVSTGGNVTSVIPITLGTGNTLGDIITISDANLGAGGAADFTFNVTKDSGINARHNRGHFGDNSISISGDGKTIAVGDSGSALENPLATVAKLSSHPFSSGVVHMYKNVSGTWTYTETLFNLNGNSQDGFGNSVDLNLNGQILTVGAINDAANKFTLDNSTAVSVAKTGSVYMFELAGADGTVGGTWKQVKRETILPYELSTNGSLLGHPKVSADGKTIISGHKSLQTDNNSGQVKIWTEGEVNNMGDITGLAATYDFGFTGIIMGNFSTTGVTTEVHRINSNAIATGHPLRTPGTYTNVATTNFINSQGGTGVGTGLVIPTVVVRAGTGVYANPPVGTTGIQAGSVEFYFGTAGDISGAPSQFVTAGSRGTGYAGGDGFVILDSEVGGGGAPPIGRLGSQETGTNAYVSFLEVSQVSARPSGTYLDVTGTTSGAGTVGTFDIVVNSSGSVTSATSKIVGASPVQGDTITISDSSLGNGGIADLTMDIITVGVSDRNTKEIAVSVNDPTNNEIWWSYAITNNNSGKTILENRHTTPFQISSSATDDVSSYSSGSFVGPPLSTMNNFNQGTSVGIATNITTPAEMFGSHTNRVVGTYTVTNATTSGTGTIGTLQIVVKPVSETPFVQGFAQIALTGLGTGHSVGDVITVSDADLGGGGAIDVFGTISSIDRLAGTYTGVTGTSSGAGTGASFDIVVDSTGDISNVVVVTLGTGHSVGDIITISDANIGNKGFVDFTMTVATMTANSVAIHRLFGNTNRPRSFKMESLANVGTATPITTDFDYVALNTAHPLTNPTGTGPENTFVIVPNSDTNISGGSFVLTITATDGVNTKTAATTITLPV